MGKFRNNIKYGIKIFLFIGGFFVLMNLMGMGEFTELRALNIFFVVYFTNKLAQVNLADDYDYLRNLISLFTANFINVILCIVGFIIYVSLVDTDYFLNLGNSTFFGFEPSLPQVIISLFMEGMAGAAIVSFVIMQYWKDYKKVSKTLF